MTINQAIRNAKWVQVYAETSGTIFAISKSLARTIARKAEASQSFRFNLADNGGLLLYI